MSHHLPDPTKMISDTPRTDAEAFYPHDSKYKVCDADFARILKRELNAANDEIEEKRKDVVWLATEKAKLEERIKRLVQAGDCLLSHRNSTDYHEKVREWDKATKDKP